VGLAGIALCVTGSTVRQRTIPLGRESPIMVSVLWPLVFWHGLSCRRGLMCHPWQQCRFQSESYFSQCSVNDSARSGLTSDARELVSCWLYPHPKEPCCLPRTLPCLYSSSSSPPPCSPTPPCSAPVVWRRRRLTMMTMRLLWP